MTLREELSKHDDEELLYIGCSAGFVFIGTKPEFYEDCELIEKRFEDSYRKAIKRADNNIALALRTISDPMSSKTAKTWLSKNKNCTVPESLINKIIHENLKLEKNMQAYKQNSSKRLDLLMDKRMLDRECVDVYASVREEGGTIIIIEGEDHGDYWIRSEYLEMKEKRNEG